VQAVKRALIEMIRESEPAFSGAHTL
jgi:hypothetical protein